MKHILANSSGKDSQAVLLWLMENLKEDFDMVFCDTGWEHPFVYDHLKYQEQFTGKQMQVLKSKKYDGFADMCIKKKRVASTKARFCTEELKVKPMIDYILSLNDDVIVYQGVRNDESVSRQMMKENDEYFRFYFEPYGYDKQGKPKYHTYRKKDVIAYCDKYSVDVVRPVIKWTADDVVAYSIERKMKLNPLYFNGFGRVGCFPCVQCGHSGLRLIADRFPERIRMIRDIENAIGRTFFPPGFIPDRFCDREEINKQGKVCKFATVDRVLEYLSGSFGQPQLFETKLSKGCLSVYNICEVNN